jgi:hypothetical protein
LLAALPLLPLSTIAKQAEGNNADQSEGGGLGDKSENDNTNVPYLKVRCCQWETTDAQEVGK